MDDRCGFAARGRPTQSSARQLGSSDVVVMRMTRILSVVVLMLLLATGVWAQGSPRGSITPQAAPSKAQGADVLWYGNVPPGWGGVVTSMKLLAPGVGWAERGGRYYWTSDDGANWKDITPPISPDLQVDPAEGNPYDLFFVDAHQGGRCLLVAARKTRTN